MEGTRDEGQATAAVTVVVKCPAVFKDFTDDFTLHVPATESVLGLKEALLAGHPSRPAPPDQRLIFRGKILQDDTTVSALCEQENSTRLVLHMVLRSGRYGTPEERSPPPASPPAREADRPSFAHHYRSGTASASSSTIGMGMGIGMGGMGRERPSGPIYYGILDGHGQLVYTDISNALLFDGRQFYVTRSAFGMSVPHPAALRTRYATTPNPNPNNNIQNQHQHRNRNIVRLRRLLPPLHANLDFSLLFSQLVRFGLVMLILAQGASRLRVAVLCVVFGFILLAQSGLIRLRLGLDPIRALWDNIMQNRRPPAAAPQPVPAAIPDHTEGVPDALPRRPPVPQDAPPAREPSVLVRLAELVTTFFLSMFPTQLPVPP